MRQQLLSYSSTIEPGYMVFRYVGHLSLCEQFFWYGATFLHSTGPGYVGQLGWAVECPTYPGSTVLLLCITRVKPP